VTEYHPNVAQRATFGNHPNVAQRATFGWVNDKQRKPKGFGALLGSLRGKFDWQVQVQGTCTLYLYKVQVFD